jgi:hypothetical protein
MKWASFYSRLTDEGMYTTDWLGYVTGGRGLEIMRLKQYKIKRVFVHRIFDPNPLTSP